MTSSHARESGPVAEAMTFAGYRGRLLAIAAACVVAGLLAFGIDLPVARWFRQDPYPLPGSLRDVLDVAESFAHGLGVTLVISTLLASDPALALPLPGRPAGARRNLLRLVAASGAGGVIAAFVKRGVDRVRPESADLVDAASALATFGPDALGEPFMRASQLMSFPSGHAAVAAGLASALGWMYPQGRFAFAMLALLAAAQRVASSAHYPSDVCFGAAIGAAAAAACLGSRPPWPRFVANADRP